MHPAENVIRDLHSGLSQVQIQQAEFRSRILTAEGAAALFEWLDRDGVVAGLSLPDLRALIEQCAIAAAWHAARDRAAIAEQFAVWGETLRTISLTRNESGN
jgi:hypothetical protein